MSRAKGFYSLFEINCIAGNLVPVNARYILMIARVLLVASYVIRLLESWQELRLSSEYKDTTIWNILYDIRMESSYSALFWRHRHQAKKHMELLLINHFWSHFREVSHPPLCVHLCQPHPTNRYLGFHSFAKRWVTRTISKPNRTTWWWWHFPHDIHLKHIENLRYVIRSQITCQLE